MPPVLGSQSAWPQLDEVFHRRLRPLQDWVIDEDAKPELQTGEEEELAAVVRPPLLMVTDLSSDGRVVEEATITSAVRE